MIPQGSERKGASSSLTHPLPLPSRRPSVSFGGFGLSIRWKFETAIAIIAALFLIVTLIYSQGMDFMNQELHEIQQLGPPQRSEVLGAADDHGLGLSGRSEVLRAINDLEDTHHGFVFSFLIPFMGVLGVLAAAVLGGAMAWLVIAPVSRMGQAMGKIASGDFSEPVQVENQDELGELAGRINQTSEELAKLQEATLAAERDRARWERVTQVTTAQEEERRRISRELHDDLGPSLAAIGNRLNACRYMVRTDPERVEGELEDVTKNLRGHIQEIRHLIYDLRPLALDQLGLKGAVRQQVERFGQETGIQASFTMSREVALDPLAEVTIFRVIQECLSNVQKHANASQVKVRLQSMDTGLELKVQDNGRGFDPDDVAPTTAGQGVGLFSMRERAELLRGSLSVQSSPGSGCQVILHVPSREVEVGAYSNSLGG